MEGGDTHRGITLAALERGGHYTIVIRAGSQSRTYEDCEFVDIGWVKYDHEPGGEIRHVIAKPGGPMKHMVEVLFRVEAIEEIRAED